MEFCKATFEILKFLTPYILAGVVYLFWHLQKEKEVLANESKNLILKLNEIMDASGDLFDQIKMLHPKQKDISAEQIVNLKNNLISFKLKISLILDSMDFLREAIDSVEIIDIAFNCNNVLMKVFNEYQNQASKLVKNEMTMTIDELVEVHNNLVDIASKVKKTFFQYALFRNRKMSSIVKS